MRELVTIDELVDWMNGQLHKDEDYQDCRFTSVSTLRGTDKEGVNWSTPCLRCSGVPASICTGRAHEIEQEARKRFNLK